MTDAEKLRTIANWFDVQDHKVGRLGNVQKDLRRIADKLEQTGAAVCGDCGEQLTLVRPGKHQCDNVNCISNKRVDVSEGAAGANALS